MNGTTIVALGVDFLTSEQEDEEFEDDEFEDELELLEVDGLELDFTMAYTWQEKLEA